MENIIRAGVGKVKVLLIPPLSAESLGGYLTVLPSKWKIQYTFYLIAPIPKTDQGNVDYTELTSICCKTIEKEEIQVIYADKRFPNIIKAVLSAKYPTLKGPSLRSVALSNHKYYASKLIDSSSSALPKHLVNVEDDLFETAIDVLHTLPLPYMMRICLGSGHSKYCCFNKDQLIGDLESAKKDLEKIFGIQKDYLSNQYDWSEYPNLLKPVVLLSSFIDRFASGAGSSWRYVYIEAAVFEGEIIPWAIVDSVTLPYDSKEPKYFLSGFEMPTKLSLSEQNLLWSKFKADIANFMKLGMNNSFVYGEYMVFNDGLMELVTISACPQFKCTHMYLHALVDGNNITASLQMACGVKPKEPKLSGAYTLTHYLMVIHVEGKINELIDFEKASKYPSVLLKFKPGHELQLGPAQDYISLGSITVTGENFDKCLDEIKATRKNIIRLPELVPL